MMQPTKPAMKKPPLTKALLLKQPLTPLKKYLKPQLAAAMPQPMLALMLTQLVKKQHLLLLTSKL